MKHNRLFVFIVALMSVSMILAACAPKAVATTEAPAPVPVAAKPTEAPKMVITGDCANGQILKEIAAVDDLTVKFTLCVPDPAFPQKAAFSAFSIQPKAYLEKAMVDRSILEKPVGTGP